MSTDICKECICKKCVMRMKQCKRCMKVHSVRVDDKFVCTGFQRNCPSYREK